MIKIFLIENTLAANLVKTPKYDQNGLITSNNNELDCEELNLDHREVTKQHKLWGLMKSSMVTFNHEN